MQFDRRVAGRRMVNAGSVGMSYADLPGAYWALLSPEVGLRRTAYDFEVAAEAVRPPSSRSERSARGLERMGGPSMLPHHARIIAGIPSRTNPLTSWACSRN
jgi:hypothetical protein